MSHIEQLIRPDISHLIQIEAIRLKFKYFYRSETGGVSRALIIKFPNYFSET